MSIYSLIEEKKKSKLKQKRASAVKNISLGAFIGVTVGSIGGLLLAPKSGKETREDIKEVATDFNDTVKNKLVETKKTTISNLVEAKRKINEYLDSKEAVRTEAKEEFEELIQNIDEELEKEIERQEVEDVSCI